MPTTAERDGDFSRTLSPLGQPVEIIDPRAGSPFDGNVIPGDRISPQARALLELFPFPNFNENARYNYQVPVVGAMHQDAAQGRVTRSISQKNTLAVNFDVQSVRSDNANLFQFTDASRCPAPTSPFNGRRDFRSGLRRSSATSSAVSRCK